MFLLHRLFIIFQISSSSFLCSTCSKGLSLNSNLNIGVCPTGYSQSGSTCISPANIYYLLDVDFSNSVTFTDSTISLLSVPSGTFSSPGNPFPTKERGFYFPKNSYLVYSNTFIPSPIQSYNFYARIFEYGTIIIIEGLTTFLEIKVKNSITLDYRYCGIDLLCTLAQNTLVYTSENSENHEWIYYSLDILENDGYFALDFYKDIDLVISFYPSGENAIGVSDTTETFTAKIGNQNGGFRGFLYRFSLSNVFNFYYMEVYYVSFCDPYYYLENNQCYSTDCPTLSPLWAVRSTCSICSNNQCSSCSSYEYNYFECYFLTPTPCEYGCSKCTSNTCQVCDTHYFTLSNGTKTYCNNSILFILTSNRLGDHIISGSNKNTDFENNPENDDPIPSPGRGFYFDGDAFLTTQTSFVIPVDFVISMWVYPISGSVFGKGSILETTFDLTTSMILTSFKDFSTTSISLTSSSVPSTWQYYSIQAYYIFSEKIRYGIGVSSQESLQGKKILLDNLSNQFYLGKGSTGFTGFIAYFFIGSINLDNSYTFGYGYDVSFPFGSTLNPCYGSSTMSCTVTCSHCDLCKDTSTNDCFVCPYGSYHDQVTCAGLSNAGYNTYQSTLYRNRGSCLLNFKGLACSQCDSPYVLYDNVCISFCPTGYTLASNKCFQSTSNIFSFFGENYLTVSVMGDVTFGSSTQEYPNIDANDPIPAYDRGYFFTSSSYLTVSQITLGPRFKVSIWMFQISFGEGIVIRKYNSANTVNFILSAGIELISTVSTVFTTKSVNNFNYEGEWQYYSLSVSFDPALLSTTLTSSYLTGYKQYTYIEFDFYEDTSGFNMVFGSDQNDGFSGFLYSIQIFNEDDIADDYFYEPDGLSCYESPFENACLSDCLNTEYYNTMSEQCDACSGSCTYGCVRSADCVLCTRKLCDECSSFESSCITCKAGAYKDAQGNCECGSGYIEDSSINQCVSCASNCDECYGILDSECTKCQTGYKFYTNFQMCIPADTCCGINQVSSDSCTYTDTLLISSEFNSFLDVFYDTSNQISFKTGSTSDSYPSYSTSDPWVIYGRGMYFDGSQFLEMDKENKFKFGPEFTISLWAKVYYSGSLFLRKDSTTLIELIVDFTQDSTSILIRDDQSLEATSSTSTYTTGVWNLLQYFIGPQISSLTFLNQLKSVYTNLFHDWFKDSVDASNTYIGKFKGFIWSIDIYNYLHEVLENNNGGPQSISVSLNECLALEYSDLCTSCPSSCIYGCRRAETCSMCQDSLCKKCSTEDTCLECFSHAEFKSGVCECILDFNSTSMTCNPVLKCFGFCSKCYSEDWNACYQCKSGYYLFEGVCISCPTGSLERESCAFKDDLVFESKFEQLKGVFYDDISNIPVITGNSEAFYPDFDSEDPFPAYLRGFYFDGTSSVLRLPVFGSYKSPKLTLSINWTIEIWFNPKSSSSCLFSLTETSPILSICFNSSIISVTLSLLDSLINTSDFETPSVLSSWNFLSLKFSYQESTILSTSLNSLNLGQSTLSRSFLSNFSPSQLFEIGKSSKTCFKGFIYQVSVFAGASSSSRLLLRSNCLNSLNGYCIPDCGIDQFWVGPGFNDCQECKAGCTGGCRKKDSCSLCLDPLCDNCNNFQNETCHKCSSGSFDVKYCKCEEGKVIDFNEFRCVECRNDQFYDQVTCVNCPELCDRCTNSSFCIDCTENSHLENYLCVCDLGFQFEGFCKERWFLANASKTGDFIQISFTEELMEDLKENQMEVTDSKKYLKSFSIEKIEKSNYLIKLSLQDIMKKDTKVCIKFTSPIFSINRSKLNNTLFNFIFPSNEYIYYVKQAENSGKVVSVSLTATAVSISLVNPNPATLWSFVSNIQMLCFIGLSTIDMPPQFFGYLRGLKNYNMFPNFFEYFITDSEGQKPYQRAYDFGYKNHLILKNIGNFITAFIFMLFMWLLNFICFKLNKIKPFSIKFIKEKIENNLKNYRYSALIRFWIISYLDFSAASFFGVFLASDITIMEIFNFIMSLVALVRFTQFLVLITPLAFYFFFKFNSKKIKSTDEELKVQYGALFEEFNSDKGLSSLNFYLAFFLRRIVYIYILIIIRGHPVFQLVLNILLALFTLAYLAIYKPFGEMILNISNCITEFIIALIFMFLSVSEFDISSELYDRVDRLLVTLVNVVLSVQMIASIFVFVRTIYSVVRSKCKKNRRVASTTSHIGCIDGLDFERI